jgi:hypothetical protein
VAKPKEPVNPFYVLLVVVGVVFLVTACAYGVMAYRAIAPRAGAEVGQHPMTHFLDRHGITLLAWELGLLAAATFAAMWLDRYRLLRQRPPTSSQTDRESPQEIK